MTMRTFTSDEIKEILRLHALSIRGYALGVTADLSRANLSEANLSGADLSRANLSGADLRGVEGKDIITYSRGQHELLFVDGFVRIGCQYHSLEYWIDNGVAIGESAGYSSKNIKHYMDFIKGL